MKHLYAIAVLLASTLVVCSVLYPTFLWLVGQSLFPNQAEGSLVDSSGKPAQGKDADGSLLFGQPLSGGEYGQPRPSAVGYQSFAADVANTSTVSSGASNWGASNALLRDRVARQLGPIVKYGKGAAKQGHKPGALVGPDI